MYVHILKFAMGLALLVNVVVAAVLLATGHPPGKALQGLITFPFVTAIMVFGWVTLVFALIDAKVGPAALADVQSGHKAIFEKWDPRTLPPLPRHPVHGALLASRARPGRRRARVDLVARDSVQPVPAVWSRLGLPRTGSRPARQLHAGGDCRRIDRGLARRRALASGLSRGGGPGQQRCWASPPWAPFCGPAVRISSRPPAPARRPTWSARWPGSIGPSSWGLWSSPSLQ